MKNTKLILLAGAMSVLLMGCASMSETPKQQKQFDSQIGVGDFGPNEDSQQSLLEREG